MPENIAPKKSFHKTPTGGGAPFYETFSQNRFFLKDGFPYYYYFSQYMLTFKHFLYVNT